MTVLDQEFYPACIDFAKEQYNLHWIPEEISFINDATDYQKLNPKMKTLITWVFSFFTQLDLSVGDVYGESLTSKLRDVMLSSSTFPQYDLKDVKIMTTAFSNMENIHAIAYQYLADTLDLPNDLKTAWQHNSLLEKKINSINLNSTKQSLLSNGSQFLLTLSKFILKHEGLTLFSIFAVLYAFTQDGKMKGSQKIIRFSMRDETLHVKGVAYIIKHTMKLLNLSSVEYSRVLGLAIDCAREEITSILDILRDQGFYEESFISQLSPTVREILVKMPEYLEWLLNIRICQLSLIEDYSSISECPISFLRTVVNTRGDIVNEQGDFLTEEITSYTNMPSLLLDDSFASFI